MKVLVYGTDIVYALILSMEKGINKGPIQIGNSTKTTINEIADAFGEYPKEYIEEWPGEMRETLCQERALTHAESVLGWIPKKDIIEYIKETNEF